MLITEMQLPAINDLIQKSFVKGVKKDAGDVRMIFHKETQDWKSTSKRIHEIDRERIAQQKVEGKPSVQKGMGQGYFKDIVRKTVSITRIISGEKYKGLEAQGLAQYAMDTGTDVVDKIELDMRNFIGYGASSSYTDNGGFTIDLTTGDGFPLFYSYHSLKHSTKTYSNILSGAPSLSEDALPLAEDYFKYNIYDNYGQKLKMKPNAIITTDKSVMVNRVDRLFGSTSPEKIEGTANANAGVKNSYKSKYTHYTVEFDVDANDDTDATKSYNWLLGCIGGSPETSFQGYYVSWLSPMTAPAEVDQDAWTLSYTSRSAYGLGAVSGKGLLLVQATA